MNRRRFCRVAGSCVSCLILDHGASSQTSPQTSATKLSPEITALLDRTLAAHGGDVLRHLHTLHEVSETRVTGPMGYRLPARHYDVWLDRAAGKSRWQSTVGGKLTGILEQTPDGIFLWTSVTGTQTLTRNDPFLALSPLGGDSLLGLLALAYTTDTVTLVEKGEIAGQKGPMIVRTQSTPVDTLIEAGRTGIQRARSRTTWSYLFAADGTLKAERSVETSGTTITETQLSFDDFQTFGGIRYPTEIGIKSSLAPKGISIHSSVKQVVVNEPVAAGVFQMP